MKPHTRAAALMAAALLTLLAMFTWTSLAVSQTAPSPPEEMDTNSGPDSLAERVRIAIRGTIRDANGSPVRNAKVRLVSETDTLEVVSDGHGRFHARIPTKYGVAVRVRAPGYRDFVRFMKPARSIGVSLTLPPPYPMSSVTVIASASPETPPEEAAASTPRGT